VPGEKRELAAIMFTDVAGYTALSQRDERLALELLEEHARLLRRHFQRHGGREIKALGDGFLVEFPSALQAAECAVAIQRSLAERNAGLPPKRHIHIRIGLHLGDIVRRGGDVFGDAVNIASRLQALAEPGGVCLSGQVYAQVWNKLEEKLVPLGKKRLKHVEVPVEVYRVILKSEDTPVPPGGKWRIAVLPFANISPDPADEYFADGMTEELIFTLSKIERLRVIAYTSVMAYKGRQVTVSQVGRELRVGMVVEGSVRKAGNRLRITVQLVDVDSEEHLWSQVYDRELEDVFAIQSDIAQQVAQALEVKVLAGERARLRHRPTRNMEAYKLYLKGRYFWNARTEEGFKKAIRCFKRAIEVDPTYALAYTGLADVYSVVPFFLPVPPKEAFPRAREAALRALELDDDLAEAHASLGAVLMYLDWDRQGAERELREAVKLKPGYATAHLWYAIVLIRMYEGRLDEARRELEYALDLDPLSVVANTTLAELFIRLGEPEAAVDTMLKLVELAPDHLLVWTWLGLAYGAAGKYSQAKEVLGRARGLPSSWTPMVEAVWGYVHALKGEEQQVRRALTELLRRTREEYLPPSWIAGLYAALGKEECFAWLDEARRIRDPYLLSLHRWAAFNPVRQDHRFQEFLAELGLDSG